MEFPAKTVFGGNFALIHPPNPQAPPKSRFNFYCRLAISEFGVEKHVSVAAPAEPRGENKLFLCKFWAVKTF